MEGIRCLRTRLSSPRMEVLRMPLRTTLPPGLCICRDPNCKIPYGECHCGCSKKTRIAPHTIASLRHIKGEPRLYCIGHKRWSSDAGPEPAPIPGVRFIPLTRGQWAAVSEHRYEYLMQWRWHAWFWKKTGKFYAARTLPRVNGKHCGRVYMHRQILGLEKGDLRRGDHIRSEETLNNTDENLRFGTHAQNNQNRCGWVHSASGFKGVVPYSKGYVSQITKDGERTHIGCFPAAEEAARAYDRKALEIFGEFARLNFPDEKEQRLAEIEAAKKEAA